MVKVRLKELGTISTGNTPSKKVDEYWSNRDIKFIKPDVIKDELCVISSANEYISASAKNVSRIVPANSILVTCIGEIGRVGITEEEVSFNQQINAIVPNEVIIPKYLAYAIYVNRKQLKAIANAPVVPIINKTQFSNFEISICESVEKQNKIVRTLDVISEIITHDKKKIEALDELIKARFVEMFGDKEEMKISGYIDSLEAGKSLAGTEKCENKVLKTGAVSYDYFDNTQTKYLPKDYQPLNAHKVNPGDVIISRMNTIDLVGAAAYVWNVPDKVYLPDRLWKAKIKNDANPVFVWQTIIHPKTKKLIRRMAGGTSGSMKNISKNKFLEMLVKKATQEEQDQFAAFVAQVDKSKFALSNELAMCNFYVRLINDSITHSRIDLRMSE